MADVQVTIRPAGSQDVAEIMRIRLAVKENRITREKLAELGITETTLAEMIGSSHGCWCALAGTEMCGFAMSDRPNARVEAVFVLPGHEGRGIGKSLLHRVIEDLQNHGHQRLILTTEPESRAQGFYQSMGWAVTGRSSGDDIELELLLSDNL